MHIWEIAKIIRPEFLDVSLDGHKRQNFQALPATTRTSKVATALASYRIEKPRNPENRRNIGEKIGIFYALPIFLQFSPYFFPFLFLFSGIWGFSIL